MTAMALRRAFFSTRNSEDEYQREGQYTQSNAAQRGTHIHARNRKRFDGAVAVVRSVAVASRVLTIL